MYYCNNKLIGITDGQFTNINKSNGGNNIGKTNR